MKKLILLTTILLFCSFVYAETSITNDTTNVSANETTNVSINETVNITQNTTVLPTIEIKNFFPTSFKKGDSQINIFIQNNGPALNNLGAFIEGNGFSTYNVVPISTLATGEKNYIIATGNFRDSGKINLTITINGEKFYQEVTITSDKEETAVVDLNNLSIKIEELKTNYNSLEQAVADKKKKGFDVSGINLADLKNFIRNAETAVLTNNANNALVNLKLGTEEYSSQLNKLTNAPKVGLLGKMRENAVLFSTIAGALVTFFTLYELLKKKSSKIVEKVQTVKVTTIRDKKRK